MHPAAPLPLFEDATKVIIELFLTNVGLISEKTQNLFYKNTDCRTLLGYVLVTVIS